MKREGPKSQAYHSWHAHGSSLDACSENESINMLQGRSFVYLTSKSHLHRPRHGDLS